MKAVEARLHDISVVTVANTHLPDTIYRDLINGSMTPDRLKIIESAQNRDSCYVKYSNGMHVIVNQRRINIGNEYDEPLNECLNDEVHALAAKFVKAYSDVSYQAIGRNCTISLPHNDPLHWMTQKFLKAKSAPKNVSMAPKFIIKTDDAGLVLAFTPYEEPYNGQQRRFVIIECNHHHGGPFKTSDDILRAVMGWQDTRDAILARLGEVLELE